MMRSRRTTNILLLLAFLFILAIIVLCLPSSTKKDSQSHKQEGFHETYRPEDEKTTTGTTTTTTKVSPPKTVIESTTTTTTEHTPLYTHASTKKHSPIYRYIDTTTHEPTTVDEYSPTFEPATTYTTHVPKTTTKHTPATTMDTQPPIGANDTAENATLATDISESETEIASHENDSFTLITEYTTQYTTLNFTEPTNETSTTWFKHFRLATLNTSTEYSTTSHTSLTTTTPPATNTTTTTPTTTTTTFPQTTTTTTTTTTPLTTTLETTTRYIHLFDFYKESKGICTSAACKDLASKMLDSIDHKMNPCENFYEFACGGVTEDLFLDPENAPNYLDSILKEQLPLHQTDAFTFYQSCISSLQGPEEISYEEVFPTQWKVSLPKSEETQWPSKHLTDLLLSLMKRDLSILFDVTVDIKTTNGELTPVPKIRISLFDSYEEDIDYNICIEEFDSRLNTRYRQRNLDNGTDKENMVDNSTDKKNMLDSSTFEYEYDAETLDKPERFSEHVGIAGNLKSKKSSRKTIKTHERLHMPKTNEKEHGDIDKAEHIDIDIYDEYIQYIECMNTTGLDARLTHLKTAIDKFQLFDSSMKELEKKSMMDNVKYFLRSINHILLSPAPQEKSDKVTTITLDEIKNDKKLNNSIDWEFFFEKLYDQKLNETQEILLDSKEKLAKISRYFRDNWEGRNLENIFLMLAAEKMFIKSKNSESIKEYCFQTTKQLLPNDMSLLFTKSYHHNNIIKLIGEINMLGSRVASSLAENSTVHSHVSTAVEFVNLDTLNAHIEERKMKVNISDNYLDNVYNLQKNKRSDMYKLFEMDKIQQDDCRFLPKETKIKCNFLTGRNLVPLEQLVPPNYYYVKTIPNYLRLAGVTFYITTALTQNITDLSIEGYEDIECVRETIPSSFNVTDHKYNKAKYHLAEHLRKETADQFRALNVVWREIRKLNSDNAVRSVNETHEMSLIWLGEKELTPIKAFVIRKAQNLCRPSNKIDLLKIARFRIPPEAFWINHLIKIDPLFASAFKCPNDSQMNFIDECNWYDPHNPYSAPT